MLKKSKNLRKTRKSVVGGSSSNSDLVFLEILCFGIVFFVVDVSEKKKLGMVVFLGFLYFV